MPILITGGTGRLGNELLKVFPDAFHPTHDAMDITNKEQVSAYLRSIDLEVLIHTAALTSLQECEQFPDKAWQVNVNGTYNLAHHIKANHSKCLFVFISSPAVFRCDRGNYSEQDVPYPANQYGITKLAGEIISGMVENHIVVRTNFVDRYWKPEKAFTDRFGTFLYSDVVAKAVKELIERKYRGIVHVCGSRKLSMYELATLSNPAVARISLQDIDGKLMLPKDMSLITRSWFTYELEGSKNADQTS